MHNLRASDDANHVGVAERWPAGEICFNNIAKGLTALQKTAIYSQHNAYERSKRPLSRAICSFKTPFLALIP